MFSLEDEEVAYCINALELAQTILLSGIMGRELERRFGISNTHFSPMSSLAMRMVEYNDARTQEVGDAALNITPEGGADNPGEG